ncbi:NAD kinase [Psychroflexus sp. CAK57W]|uniref:NAD kinase n=1 Tax=Psychroflexus curvus TaxID=2873595 RepID=UPI001CCDC8EA|nr:NAD kinase [Psychroflexus curvus]MBZ9628679.1 NAD kinase [Psychroflexus curvus]MBZ9786758.1 NAD kinase [Psychroflexus curvus]
MTNRVAIFGQSFYPETEKYLAQLLEVLKSNGVEVIIEKEYFKLLLKEKSVEDLQDYTTFETLNESVDLFFTIGGDGTILSAVKFVKNLNIPIIGINTGRLGFLATVHKDEIKKSIEDILAGNYKASERSLLEVKLDSEDFSLGQFSFALNDVAISRKETTSMITIETWLNDEFLNSYWSDGIIISTPTGSTGYSLSCGGPIVTPQTKSFIITPIAPHNLNARPLVIPDHLEIKLKISGREDQYLISLDSRLASLDKDTIVRIKKADFNIKLVWLQNDSFITTLRKKLSWGQDKRN